MRAGPIAAALAALLACNREERPMAVEVPPAAPGSVALPSAPPEAAVRPSGPAAGRCSRGLRVAAQVPDTPTCQIWGLQQGAEGTLEVPCSGAGPATARFGDDAVFEGKTDGRVYSLRREFTEAIGDGCEWSFTETLTGTGGALVLRYDERITAATASCYRPCGATSQLELR